MTKVLFVCTANIHRSRFAEEVFNYFSEKNIGLVKHNRFNPEEKIRSNIGKLPVLSNDTNNVIEFNSGFENSNNKNYKRSFWELFK